MRKKVTWKHWAVTLAILLLLPLAVGTKADAASPAAKIGKTKYTSLEKAVKKVKNNQTIVLKKNVTLSKALSISRSGKKFTLNLNKKTITLNKKGSLKLQKGTMTVKNGKITHKVSGGTIFDVAKGAALKVNDGTYTGNIKNAGTTTISGGSFTSNISKKDLSASLLLNVDTGKMTITKGTFNGNKNAVIFNQATMTINGGTFKNSAVFDDNLESAEVSNGTLITNFPKDDNSKPKLTINGGTFTSGVMGFINDINSELTINKATVDCKKGGVFLNNWGTLTVSGGNFRIHDDWGVLYSYGGNVALKDGTYTSDWSIAEAYDPETNITINGGNFTSYAGEEDSPMLLSFNGKIDVQGGTFNSDNGYLYWITKDEESEVEFNVGESVDCKTKYMQKETDDPC